VTNIIAILLNHRDLISAFRLAHDHSATELTKLALTSMLIHSSGNLWIFNADFHYGQVYTCVILAVGDYM